MLSGKQIQVDVFNSIVLTVSQYEKFVNTDIETYLNQN